MSDEVQNLKNLSSFFKKMSGKMRIYTLLTSAKLEYDKYNYEGARSLLEELLSQNPDNTTALRGLGCIELAEKNYEKAFFLFNKALDNSDKKEVEYTLLGIVFYLQEKLDEALEYFNLAIDTNDDYTEAYEGRNQTMLENHIKLADLQESLIKRYIENKL